MNGQCHVLAISYPWERAPLPIVQEAGWTLGLVWMGVKDLPHTAVQTLNLPACSDLL